MFSVEARISMLESEPVRDKVQPQPDTFDYLFAKFMNQSPWQPVDQYSSATLQEDFILIAEFSEQEGPRPVIVIPKDGGQNFDQNEFSVKILAVDHQSSTAEGFEATEDAQVVMSDPDTCTHAFIHHIVLNDIQARGYVRPFCISYVTPDPQKIMKCYEEISSQMKKVARLMKYGNRLVFMRDLEKHHEDLSYTKTQLLLSQSRMQVSSQTEGEILNTLNTLRQCMEEVKDIIGSLRPLIQNDTELSERFQSYEQELKGRVQAQSKEDSDVSSLHCYGRKGEDVKEISGSYTERTTPEFSLFSKVKDQKPKMLDVSTIRGKRRFDRSLRGLHELCSWGAKEGLQRLRAFREFLKRDLVSIYVDELDISALEPEKGVLCFGNHTVGANFLSTSGSIRNACCVNRKMSEMTFHRPGMSSFGSVDSFKSLPSSFQSFYDDDQMYSARSSMVDTASPKYHDGQAGRSQYQRQTSQVSSDFSVPSDKSHDDVDLMFQNENFIESSADSNFASFKGPLLDNLESNGNLEAVSFKFYNTEETDSEIKVKVDASTPNYSQRCSSDSTGTLMDGFSKVSTDLSDSLQLKIEDDSRPRGGSGNSEFENIEIETDLKCIAKGCKCSYGYKSEEENNIKTNGARKSWDETQEVYTPKFMCNNTGDRGLAHTGTCHKYHETDDFEQDGSDARQKYELEHGSDSVMTDSTATLCVNAVEKDIDDYTVHDQRGSINACNIPDQRAIGENSVTGQRESHFFSVLGDSRKVNKRIGNRFKDIETKVLEDLCLKDHFDTLDATEKDLGRRDTVTNKETSFYSIDSGLDLESAHEKGVFDRSKSDRMGLKKNSCTDFERFASGGGLQYRYTDIETRRRRFKFMHPLRTLSLSEGESSVGQALQKMFCYNSLPHIVYSLLSGRPVVVIGNRKQDGIIKEFVQALSVFVPYVPRSGTVSLLCPRKQLKMSEIHKFQLLGLIRSDRHSVDYLLPKSIRRYITLADVEKMVILCQPYQGTLLNFITGIHNKRKTFKSDLSLLTYVQLCLEEISTKAFSFYHSISSADGYNDFSGTSLPRKSVLLELTSEKYLNKAGVMNSDCRILKYLSEIVILQQIEEEFQSKYLTDAPAFPFTVSYQSLHTYKL